MGVIQRQGQVILNQMPDVHGIIGWVGGSDGRLSLVPLRAFEGLVDGVKSVLEEWVRHGDGAAIESSDGDERKSDDLGRRDYIARGSPIPVRCSKVLGCGCPSLSVNRVLLRNIESMALHHLLYDSISNSNMMSVSGRLEKESEGPRKEQHMVCAKLGISRMRECSILAALLLRRL
jgi:hypothetical protein